MKTKIFNSMNCKNMLFVILCSLSYALHGQIPKDLPWWPPNPCPQPSVCELITHNSPLDDPNIYLGSLTQNPIDNICTQSILSANVVECWFPLAGTPGVPMDQPPGSICSGNATSSQMLNEFSLGAAGNGHVAMMGQLSNFIANHTYTMYFKVKTSGLIDNFHVKLGNHLTVNSPNTQSYGGWLESEPTVLSSETVFTTSAVNNPGFTYYCFSFTPTANYDMIYLYPKLNSSAIGANEMLYISDIHLMDISTAAFPANDYVLNCNQTSLQMGTPDCTVPGGGTWSWTISPAAPISGANTATPIIGPIANTSGAVTTYTVNATYTLPSSVGSCATSVSQTLSVFPNSSTTTIVGSSSYCAQNTLDFTTLLGSYPGCYYNWFIGSGGSTVVNGTEYLPTVSIDTDGAPFTLNVEVYDIYGCMYTATISVTSDCCLSDKDLVLISPSAPILLSTVIASITPLAIDDIYIQGELIVDGNYTLFKKEITFGPGSKVTVLSNKTLTILGTVGQPSHLHGCTAMWQGIFAELPGSKVVVNRSIIEDAVVGVFVKNTGNVRANYSKFINNYIGIRYENYTSASSNYVRGCVFRSQSVNSLPSGFGNNPGYLLAPYSGQHGVAGIEIYNCPYIAIAPSGAPNLNKFEFMKNGIIDFNSDLFVGNASFTKLEHYGATTPPLNDGIGIRCINQTNTIKTLRVDNSHGLVKFRVSDNGIIVDGTYNSNINNNEFITIKYRAISHAGVSPIFTQPQVQLTVTGNKIVNAFEGIFYYNCGKTISKTELNVLNNPSPIQNSRGIIVEESSLGSNSLCDFPLSTILIKNNTSRGFSIGISASNASCMNIFDNNIYLQAPSIYQHHGIWLNSSPRNTITTNNIYGNWQDWHCIGTRFYKSNSCVIGCNYIEKTDVALWIDNDCNFSQIVNNTFNKYNNAIFFVSSGRTGTQYFNGDYLTTYNSFDKTANSLYEFTADNSVVGSNSIFYFWDTTTIASSRTIENIDGAVIFGGIPFDIQQTAPSPSGVDDGFPLPMNNFLSLKNLATGIFTPNPNISNSCGGNFINGPLQGFSSGEISDKGFTSFYQSEHTWMHMQNLLRSYDLIKDSIDQASLPSNVVDLLNTINASDVKTLDSVEVLLGIGNWSAANKLNNSCNASCNYSRKLQEINRLLIPLWDSIYTHPGYVVDLNLLQPIVDIANLCVVEYGDAVLKARIFLRNHVNPMMEFIDECETTLPRYNPVDINEDHSTAEVSQYTLYPDPANNLVNVHTNDENEITYQVVDLQNRIVAKGVFTGNLELNTSDLPNGIYFMGLTNNELQTTKKIKFIIAH